jgi:hypothetical protein
MVIKLAHVIIHNFSILIFQNSNKFIVSFSSFNNLLTTIVLCQVENIVLDCFVVPPRND